MAKQQKNKPQKQVAAKAAPSSGASIPFWQRLDGQVAIALFLLAFGLYAHTLGHGYALDDNSVITDSHIVTGGMQNIPEVFATRYREGSFGESSTLYRPLSVAMFTAEWAIAPDTPQLSHLVNVLLYALTCGLLFLTFRSILHQYSYWIPLLAVLLFALHPVHTEIVANIKSRDEILVMLFATLALRKAWEYAQSPKGDNHPLFLSGLAMLAAVFSKENAVNFIIVIPLTLYFFSKASPTKIWATAGLYLAATFIYLLARVKVLGSILSVKEGSLSMIDNFIAQPDASFWEQKATAVWVLGKYLCLLVFPYPLICDYNYNYIPITQINDPWVILSLLVHLALLGYAFMYLTQKRFLSYAILFYLLNMFLYSNLLVTIGAGLGERFLYVASLGFTLALAYGLVHFLAPSTAATPQPPKEWKDIWKGKITLWGPVLVLALVSAFLTVRRAAEWKDSFTLYSADITKAPESARLNGYMGTGYLSDKYDETQPHEKNEGYLEKAIHYYSRALDIYPDYTEARGQLALAYYRNRNYPEAAKHFELAIADKECKGSIYSNYGQMYFKDGLGKQIQGDKSGYDFAMNKAKEFFEEAVKREANYADGYLNLGSAYGATGNHQMAIQYFQTALKYAKPGKEAGIWSNIAVAHRNLGNEAAAKEAEAKARALQ